MRKVHLLIARTISLRATVLVLTLLLSASGVAYQDPSASEVTPSGCEIGTAGANSVGLDVLLDLVAPAQELRIVAGDQIEAFLENLANGQPLIFRTRLFQSGEILECPMSSIQYDMGLFDPVAESLVVLGEFNGVPVVAELRFLEVEGRFFVLQDIYTDETDLSIGRGIPVPLDNEAYYEESGSSQELAAATTAAPQITSVSGYTDCGPGISNGRVAMAACGGCGRTWDGNLVINDQVGPYAWVINGKNFGTSQGTIKVAGRTAVISSWTNTQIRATPTVPYNWGPMSTLLTVSGSTGTANYGVGIVPSVRTRIFGQCTWHVAKRRIEMGLQPSPTAYNNYTAISPSWVPRRGDQLKWGGTLSSGGTHQAIIEQVSGPTTSGGVKTYTLTISQYNAACNNEFSNFTTTFQTTSQSVIAKPKFSNSSGGATGYYR
jgi:hypothetical protein